MREEAEKAADEAAKELVAANDEIDEAKRREGDALLIKDITPHRNIPSL